ncbi:MAG: hypothetical protein GY903_08085 [Fuerstiella sp.]|nr:hypothetical protein [Fuerstiella sp.]MCP4854438.1 hypothetical protein [Fuerstiella sp.]
MLEDDEFESIHGPGLVIRRSLRETHKEGVAARNVKVLNNRFNNCPRTRNIAAMAIYIPKGKLAYVFNGQVMMKPMDNEYLKWGKTTVDPVNKPTLPNNIDGYAWKNYIRDPAFFKVDGRTFMIRGITGSQDVGAEEAITRLTALVEREPNLDMIWFMLSEIYECEGLRSDALEAAKRCLEVLLRFGGNRDNIDMVKQRISALR